MGNLSRTAAQYAARLHATTVMENSTVRIVWNQHGRAKPYITIEGQYTGGEKSGQWIHNYQRCAPKPALAWVKVGLKLR